MKDKPKTKRGWRLLRWGLIGLAVIATLVAIFYTEEDWRGKRAWENCKRELEAKGAVLEWDKFIPPPVPDDQNFFAAPKMQEWFVKNQSALTNDLTKRLLNPDTTATNLNETAAINYLTWSDLFQPDFDLIRQALKRPYARMGGDYTKPFEIPIPNFVAVRMVAQVLAQRAHCHVLLSQPEEAMKDLTLMHEMCRLLEGAPAGKPMTLVSAMINVAISGLYANTMADGFKLHGWQEPQLAALQEQLKAINLPPLVVAAFKLEPAASIHTFETTPAEKLADLFGVISDDHKTRAGAFWRRLQNPLYLFLKFAPRGWWYQNLVNYARIESKSLDGFDLEDGTISPRAFDEITLILNHFFDRKSPFKLLAAIALPNTVKATQTLAYNQTLVNEAQIVCALERFHLAHGEYPETLGALRPQFMETIPHDLIGGEPLHYRRTEDGKFRLYSVGWNERDDGGLTGTLSNVEKGDWVWQHPQH